MQFTDILSFCFSILGLYGLVYYLRFLIPRNLLPYVSAVLTEAKHLLDRAESTGIIPQTNDYRSALTLYKAVMSLPTDGHLTDHHSYSNQLLRIRMESHRAPRNPTATSACCSVRSNVQAVYALVASRGNQSRDQGSLNFLLFYPHN